MKFPIGILAAFAMLHGEALACKDRSGQQDPAPKTRPTPAPKGAESPEARGFYKQAAVLESEGRGAEAVKMYVRAARAGSAAAAQRLGHIYEKGANGVKPSYEESSKWKNLADSIGEDVALSKCR
jgi:TPR repeat protein